MPSIISAEVETLQRQDTFIRHIFPCYLQAKAEKKVDSFFAKAYLLYGDRFPVPRQKMLDENRRFDRVLAKKVVDEQRRVRLHPFLTSFAKILFSL